MKYYFRYDGNVVDYLETELKEDTERLNYYFVKYFDGQDSSVPMESIDLALLGKSNTYFQITKDEFIEWQTWRQIV